MSMQMYVLIGGWLAWGMMNSPTRFPKEKFGLCATWHSKGMYQNAFAGEAADVVMYGLVMNM